MQTWHVILLGLIEGLTEFLPVSSTGHLLLTEHFLGVASPGRTFEVLIQLGAILAILSVYSAKLLRLAAGLPGNPRVRRFVLAVLIAFLPAAVIGAVGHGFIKRVLFETPWLICTMLVLGGIVLLAVDRLPLQARHYDVMDYPIPLAFTIGLCQAVAMVPGVSRSGATIVGALLMGTDKRSATEFSFYLAMPTMVGAFAYDLYKNHALLEWNDLTSIALGFAVAFAAGVVVVRYLLDFVSRHGFAPFAWWRIIIGGMGLGALAVLG
ncbi:MAG TPA: undecaprenyl-diphosphate phosphatase [Hyphomicrobiaceae bacterium]|nr:undecaprenyl-diphosphate phosphatase [Hyphomicrobiaceae bacterium]